MIKKDSTVLVTGGCGYIGSHVVRQLVEQNRRVVVFDNLSTGVRDAHDKRATLVEGDILDTAFLTSILVEHKVSSVLHFAGKISVEESIARPSDYYLTNTAGTASAVAAAFDGQVKSLIFSSTAAVYASSNTPVKERDVVSPLSPYGNSKLLAEQIIADVCPRSNIQFVNLRYFNVGGAHSSGTLGQRNKNSKHLLKALIDSYFDSSAPIQINGDDYKTRDGSCMRDFIHVMDLADLHVQFLSYLENGGTSQTVNCGYGRGTTVKEMVDVFQKASGKHLSVTVGPRRQGDLESVVADTNKLEDLLPHWKAKHENLEEMCKSALAWESKLRS